MARTHVFATVSELLTALNKWAVKEAEADPLKLAGTSVAFLKTHTCFLLDRPGPFDLSESIDLGELTPVVRTVS